MKKIVEIIDIALTDISKLLKYVENVPVDSEASNQLHNYFQQVEEIVANTAEEIRNFKKENNLMESKMPRIIERGENYLIQELNIKDGKKIQKMYVSDDFVKKHDEYNEFDKKTNLPKHGINFLHSDLYVRYSKNTGIGNVYRMDIKFVLSPNPVEDFRWYVAGMSGDFGFNMGLGKQFTYGKRIREHVFKELVNIIKKEERSNKLESEMDEKKLREFIRAKVVEFITEQKVLAEAEKEGHGKPTSGLKKEKVGTTHTEKTKSKNPPTKKVTDGGPENKTLTTAEPTKVESENKEKKEPDNTEFADKGKYVKEGNGYKTECMGIELDVKGSSYADINHLYLLAQMRKALEGRGEFIKKVTVEMGEKEKEKIKESKEFQQLRTKIRQLVKEELKKNFK